ncbi:MAG TPA: hypothetical protein VGR69_11485, partial [Candidatus Rubrimentiphilum sp.]|nr:hypothetical protein [Candidatus Rubrimentiphilum sp.]
MKNLLWLAAAALLAGAAPSKTPLADFVRAVLPTADKNFTPLRGAKIQSLPDTVYAGYKLRLAPSVCADCRIYDFYGRGTSPEYWDVSNIYTEDRNGSDDLVQPMYSPAPEASPIPGVPPGAIPPPPPISSASPEWSVQKTENYVIAQLSPLLHGFSLRHTTSTGLTGGMVQTLIWTNKRTVSVKAQVYPQMVA